MSYNDIFSDSEAQFKITKVFEIIIHIQDVLGTPAYPGQNTGSTLLLTNGLRRPVDCCTILCGQ